MPIAQAAVAAGSAVVKYAPAVYDKGMELVAKATSGRVKSAADIVSFVKDDPRKLSVVAGALAAGGVAPNDIIPRDLAGQNAQLAQIRATIEGVAVQMRNKYDGGSNSVVAATDIDTARDVLRKEAVQAVLAVYGSADTYFKCHPNGGVPRSDFAWYRSMGFR